MLSSSPWLLSVIEQATELVIEESDAIVIAVAAIRRSRSGSIRLAEPHIIEEELVILWSLGAIPNAFDIPAGE